MSDAARDPILDEVRQRRAQLLEECGGTIDGLMDAMKRRDAKARDTVEMPEQTEGDSAASTARVGASVVPMKGRRTLGPEFS